MRAGARARAARPGRSRGGARPPADDRVTEPEQHGDVAEPGKVIDRAEQLDTAGGEQRHVGFAVVDETDELVRSAVGDAGLDDVEHLPPVATRPDDDQRLRHAGEPTTVSGGGSPRPARARRSGARARGRAGTGGVLDGGRLAAQLVELAAQLGELGLELQHPLHAGQVEPVGGELLDAAQLGDVGVAVAAAAAGGAGRVDEALALVDAQGLRVHAGELGGHRDDVDGSARSCRGAHPVTHTPRWDRGDSVLTAASASTALRSSLDSLQGRRPRR